MNDPNDRIRLQHILDATDEVISFLGDKNRDIFNDDRLLQLALTRLIEIIGEAANHVSDSIRDHYPQVAWSKIRGMRNRLTHAYFEVDLDLLWFTITQSVPELNQQIKSILIKWDE
ncbi:MAG TPA: DUF86 domain-containing protein [Aggregatilineales bacterium]|nr:DUF86 domain-containing protein [Aggregatilineales bacterium]